MILHLIFSERGAKEGLGRDVNMSIEPGRWYDLRVEVNGRNIRGFVDDKLTSEATDAAVSFAGGVYAAASCDDASGDVIVKVVNSLPTTQQLELDLQGLPATGLPATVEILNGDPDAMNSLESPAKISPQKTAITPPAAKFTHDVPPASVTVLRLKTK